MGEAVSACLGPPEVKKLKEDAKPDESEPRDVPKIREAAGQVEAKMLHFCLDPLKKINKDQTAIIMRNFREMRGLMEELLLQNSFLQGKLERSRRTPS